MPSQIKRSTPSAGRAAFRHFRITMLSVQTIVLALYLVLLSRFIWPEEAFLLYALPAIIVFVPAAIAQMILRILQKDCWARLVRPAMIGVTLLQVLLLVAVCWLAYPRSFTREQVLTDLDHALITMEHMHPDLYATADRDSVRSLMASMTGDLPDDVPEVAVHKLLGTVAAGFGDAHTMVSIDSYLGRGRILFRKAPPYRFRIIDDRIFVRDNYSWRHRIPMGSEIVAIAGRPSTEALNDAARLVSHETRQYRDAWLQFPLFWSVWNHGGDLEISFVTPDGERRTTTVASGFIANARYLLTMARGQLSSGSFEILEGNVGHLEIRSFGGGDDFVEFLREAFAEIQQQGVDKLIIDIRENFGGSTSAAVELMQYISAREFRVFDAAHVKISDELIASYSLDPAEFEPGTMYEETYELQGLRDEPLRFDGRCCVLVGGATFSTALDFAAMVRCFDVGEIIGGDTGGRTVSFGSPHHIELPEIGLQLKVSIKSFVNACGAGNARVISPDHVVNATVEDDLNGVDPALSYAKSRLVNRD